MLLGFSLWLGSLIALVVTTMVNEPSTEMDTVAVDVWSIVKYKQKYISYVFFFVCHGVF